MLLNQIGRAFEQFIAYELRAFLSYNKKRASLKYWRSKSGFEVDFIVGNEMAIEIKAGKKISQRDHKGLIALSEEKKWKQMIIVSQDPVQARFKNRIHHLRREAFLTKLWKGLLL